MSKAKQLLNEMNPPSTMQDMMKELGISHEILKDVVDEYVPGEDDKQDHEHLKNALKHMDAMMQELHKVKKHLPGGHK